MDMAKYTIFVFIIAVIVVFSFAIMFPRSFDQIRQAAELAIKTGQLSIGGRNPRIDQIYISDQGLTFAPQGPGILSQYASLIPIVIKAYIADENGNCNAASAAAIVCPNTTSGICWQGATGAITLAMSFTNSPDGNIHCNFTANTYNLPFYQRWGDSRINVTVTDPSPLSNNSVKFWYNNIVGAVDYPYPPNNYIAFGALSNIGAWNNGTGGQNINNTGNIRVNITWNSTEFSCTTPGSCSGDIIPITNNPDSFCVDRDTTGGGGAYNNVCMAANPLTQLWYIPTGQPASLKRCANAVCNADDDGATNEAFYALYWHIYVPNVREGTYENSIQFTGYSCPTCGG